MKKSLLLILFCVCTLFAVAQHRGYDLDLNHIASITFPDTPKSQEIRGETIYTLNHDSILFMATSTSAQKGLKDMINGHSNDSLYNNLIKGSLKGANCKLIYRKNIVVNGLSGIEFGYQRPARQSVVFCYQQGFYLNNTIIFLSYWSRNNLGNNDQGMRAFFDSFKLKIKSSQVDQTGSHDRAEMIGKIIGYFLAAALTVTGIIVIVRIVDKRK